MELWIPLTLFAAFMQSWRNALQSKLSGQLSTAGVTLARFAFAAPMAAIYLCLLPATEVSADFDGRFIAMVSFAAFTQILATALMVKLFRLRNYAIGVGLAKSEAAIAAGLGALWFAAPLNATAWIGVWIGVLAVWLMSQPGKLRDLSLGTVALGLGSGLCFALTTLWVREASLYLGLPFPQAPAWVLLWVISLQTLMLALWVVIRESATFNAMWQCKGQVFCVSLFSFFGSLGWFSAMSLVSVALVKTLGQVEVLFTLCIAWFWFKERLKGRDILGLVLIAISAVCVILA